MSARKASRRHTTKASVAAKSPKTRRSSKRATIEDPLEHLLKAMNDERVPRMRRQAIARKIAPYFHPKLKPVPPESAAYACASTGSENWADDEAERSAAERQRIRNKRFKVFD